MPTEIAELIMALVAIAGLLAVVVWAWTASGK